METETPNSSGIDGALLIALEKALRERGLDPDFKAARNALREYLWRKVGRKPEGSIPEAIDVLAEKAYHNPDVAAVILRSLAAPEFLPSGPPGSHLHRSIVAVAEAGLPKVCAFVGVHPKSQTYENLEKLRAAHGRICEILAPLTLEAGSLEGIVSAKQAITTALNHSVATAYGHAFRFGAIRGIVDKVIYDVQQVLAAKSSLLLDVEQLENTLSEGLNSVNENGSFIFYDFLIPFLTQTKQGLNQFINSTRGRFSAKLKLALPEDTALQKRYPLHEPGRLIQVRVPMRNTGPGLAIAVTAKVSTQSVAIALQGNTIALGDVAAGEFSVTFDVLVMNSIKCFSAEIEIEWREVGAADPDRDIFGFDVLAQASDIRWSELEYWHPYSTDPAEGDRFVGRAETVKNLASRLLRSPMEPFYITGQKRVGKTSLALATVEFCSAQVTPYSIHSINILWGEIANADARAVSGRVESVSVPNALKM